MHTLKDPRKAETWTKPHLMRSILFWRMRMCCSRMISMAARCSEVWGCGQVSFAATSSRAPSMTAAPFSMVAMRMSCPADAPQAEDLGWEQLVF